MQKMKRERLPSKVIFTILVLAMCSYVGVAYYYNQFFLFHTQINGVDVSLLPVDFAEDRLNSELSNFELTIRGRDGEEAVFTGEQIGLCYQLTERLRS